MSFRLHRRYSFRFLLTLIGLMGQGIVPALHGAGSTGEYHVHAALSYSPAEPGLTLDLFVPEHGGTPVPCVLVIQGGGFNAQDGRKFRPFAVYLAEHGMATALIAYRGRPDHTFRDTVADTKAAVRFVRKVSASHGLDPDHIGAMGRSAGGTLTALLAVTGGMPALEGEGGNPEYSSRIQAAVAYAGVFDFVGRFTDSRQIALQPDVDSKMLSNGQWIGTPFSATGPDWLLASALSHVDSRDPPMLFIHCKDDSTVPWIQSQEMHARLRSAGVPASLIYYESGGHGFKGHDENAMADMVQFFKEQLK